MQNKLKLHQRWNKDGNFSYTEKIKEVNEPLNVIHKDVCCAACEKLLVRTVQIKDIPKVRDYKFTCPFCGGSSFVSTFKYHVHFEPVGCVVENVECEYKGEKNLCLVKLK